MVNKLLVIMPFSIEFQALMYIYNQYNGYLSISSPHAFNEQISMNRIVVCFIVSDVKNEYIP